MADFLMFDRRFLEDGIGGVINLVGRVFGANGMGCLFMAVFQPALVAAQLGVDLFHRLIECVMRVMGNAGALEDEPMANMGDDITPKRPGWCLAEGGN